MSTPETAAPIAPQVRPAPPPRVGPRLVGDPLAGLPPEIRERFLKGRSAARSGLPGAPVEVGTGGTWGTNGAGVDAAYGTILSANIKRSAEKEKYPDNNGETKAYLFYDYKRGGGFECLTAGTLEPGDAVVIDGNTLYVDDAEKQWEYKGWSKYRVNAERHDGVV